MKFLFYLLILVIFFVGCSRLEKKNDQQLLRLTIENTVKDSKQEIKDIIYNSAPSNFKNLTLEFDFFQVNYINEKTSQYTEVKYFTVNNGEIYRLGKGPNCLIISKELRWDIKGKPISNFKKWFEENESKTKIYFKKPKNTPRNNITSRDKKINLDNLPQEIKKITCL